jgi:NADH:ubiquinone reductase (H+-translocating)
MNVWAIGDCAVNPDPAGRALPGYGSARQPAGSSTLAVNIRRALSGAARASHATSTPQGALAALGCRTGVARIFGLKLSGLPAWFVWRTVYLLKMPGLRRKFRVALDWTTGLLFARDYVQLGVHRPPRQPERNHRRETNRGDPVPIPAGQKR